MARPKSKTFSVSSRAELVADEKSCGYIMHQVRSIKCKMRWGELLLGKDDRGVSWCQIALFKFDLTNPKLGMLAKKDLKLKSEFRFTEETFCGLEKGQHFTKHGTKRYICIILKDQHVIFQDAIIAMTNADHDVIQTWYKKITNSMRYMYRWKILAIDDAKFLHVSKYNTSVCLSLHNSNEGLKGKVLLQKQYKTKMIEKVEEQQEQQPDGSPCVRAMLFIRNHFESVCFILEVGKSLSSVITSINQTNPLGFDVLGYQNPNLVKISPQPKQTKSLKRLTGDIKRPMNNTYISNVAQCGNQVDLPAPTRTEGQTVSEVTTSNISPFERINGAYGQILSENSPSSPPRNYRDIPPRVPPRDQNDELKNASDTRNTFDSGFHTSDCNHHTASTQFSTNGSLTRHEQDNPYVNIAELNARVSTPPLRNIQPQDDPAPEVPVRDVPITTPINHSVDLIERALRSQSLPPLDLNPDARRPSYENSLSVEVTIDMVLNRNHGDNIDVTLGLPHATYLSIVIGLENNSVGDGDWRGLASVLHMSFEDVMKIEAATHRRERLYPAHIVLVHWLRVQAPYPFTRFYLKKLLEECMSRFDLANLINVDEAVNHHKQQD